jgi:hypothetical protein
MVKRMAIRGLVLAPVVVLVLWLWNGSDWALSGGVGLAMTLANLYLAGRIIGAVAENNPNMLLAGAMIAFTVGLGLLTVVAIALKAADVVNFKVTGLTLIASHFVLVLWEAARAYPVPRGQGIPSRHREASS